MKTTTRFAAKPGEITTRSLLPISLIGTLFLLLARVPTTSAAIGEHSGPLLADRELCASEMVQDSTQTRDTTSVAEESEDPSAVLYTQKCFSCHTIGGGDKTGPDLKGIGSRRSTEWLHQFIKTPQALYRAGDQDAVELFRRFRPEVMADQSLTDAEIDALLALIERVGSSGKIFIPPGGGLSREILPEDIPEGKLLFTGMVPTEDGIPACIFCHTASGISGFGGGTLGPDLTKSAITYSEVELVNILRNPAFPTMALTFEDRQLSDEEIVQLFAYLTSVSSLDPVEAGDYFTFTWVGMLLTIVFIASLSVLWKNRLRGVRQQVVSASKHPVNRGDSA